MRHSRAHRPPSEGRPHRHLGDDRPLPLGRGHPCPLAIHLAHLGLGPHTRCPHIARPPRPPTQAAGTLAAHAGRSGPPKPCHGFHSPLRGRQPLNRIESSTRSSLLGGTHLRAKVKRQGRLNNAQPQPTKLPRIQRPSRSSQTQRQAQRLAVSHLQQANRLRTALETPNVIHI